VSLLKPGKKTPKKFTATVVAINHGHFDRRDAEIEAQVLPKFLKYVKPGRKLFFEMTEKAWSKTLSSRKPRNYALLASRAHQAGMQVVPLDSGKVLKAYSRMENFPMLRELESSDSWEELKQVVQAAALSMVDYSKLHHYYGNMTLREKRWALLLRNAKKGDIVVMHPNHAKNMVVRGQIPEKRVAWLDQPVEEGIKTYNEILSPENLEKFRQIRAALREKRREKK